MLRKLRNYRGQSISEYVVLVGIVLLALIGMQVYMRRGINAVVKLAADEAGSQRKGGIEEYDYRTEWKVKGKSKIDAASREDNTITKYQDGAVFYDTTDKTTTSSGILSEETSFEKE